MSEVNERNKWIFEQCGSKINDREKIFRQIITQMLNKTIGIFKYGNLPDTITDKDIEILTQVGGYSVWKKVDGKLYVFRAELGGLPNVYYLPTKAIISNPALNYSGQSEIDKECVVMKNDHLYQGLMPLFNKYGLLLLEAELSLKYSIINARIPALIQADNDITKESAKEFIEKIIKGEDYDIIASSIVFDGISTHDFLKESHIKSLIEAIQYIKGSWYNEIGLNSAFNMKREAINEAEATLNEDLLYPTVDVMLECRKNAIEKINTMYGTNITVELSGIWKKNREHDEITEDILKSEVNYENKRNDN